MPSEIYDYEERLQRYKRIIKGLRDGYGNRLYNKDVVLRLYRRTSRPLGNLEILGCPKDFLGKITAKFLGRIDNRYQF